MRKLSSFGIIIAIGLLAGGTRADEQNSPQNTTANSSFDTQRSNTTDQQSQIKEAAQMNMTAIRVAEIAEQKAQNSQLKQYAQTLRQDHQQAQKDLERIAQKQNVTVPTGLDAKCQQEVSRIENLSGTEFDREFAKAAVEGHAKGIAKLQQQVSGSKSAQNSSTSSFPSVQSSGSSEPSGIGASGQSSTGSGSSDWQQYTQRMLSKMQEHQREARNVARAVGLDQSTITSLESSAREHVGSPGSNVESAANSQSTNTEVKSNNNSSTEREDSRKNQ